MNHEAASHCYFCQSPRLIKHPELGQLAIAHVDCDAFYASVEKRDKPELRDTPVLIGGSRRGVVAAACYIARTYGIKSAMPMYKALQKCPDAVVIAPNMKKYATISKAVKAIMLQTTPLVQSISIDEAYLDLSGTNRLHQGVPAFTMARLANDVQKKLGITVSIGLSYNKFLAKLASDMDKPNGFSVIGEQNIKTFLGNYPIQAIAGVGRRLETKLKNDGIYSIFDLQRCSVQELQKRYGSIGARLFNFSNGIDSRVITPNPPAKSVSKEVTFSYDKSGLEQLKPVLWRLCDQLSSSLKSKNKFGKTITLKLKTIKFRTITRSKTIKTPTQLADVIYRVAFELLIPNARGTYRLMGVGLSTLSDNIGSVETDFDFLDDHDIKQEKLEKTIDQIREKVGENAIGKGRGFNLEQPIKKK
jgi:DNA polymerase-4